DGDTWKFRSEDIEALAGEIPTAPAPAEKAPEPPAGGEEEDAGDTLMSIDADILFAEEEEIPADSAAETWIAADAEGVFPSEAAMAAPEAEPAPLALSPETDESSLQEVLSEEEVAGAEEGVFAEEPVIAVDSDTGLAAVMPMSSVGSGITAATRTRVVTLVEPPAHHGPFTVMLGLSAVALVFTVVALSALLTGAMPSLVLKIGEGSAGLVILIAGVVAVAVILLIGTVLEKQRKDREAITGQ
ncbi:MAG: hypothetical protein WBC59_09845, partial [Phycisphaerae bacterium]